MTGDLRALTGLPRTHMDFYLREGIIQPTLRTESGYLLFDDAELETLRAVLRWREEGVGIREIRDRLGRPATALRRCVERRGGETGRAEGERRSPDDRWTGQGYRSREARKHF